ncbi:type I restriction endonuclease subunit R [uncultured Brachyspira sp.]|uniref:type I restriction endonuclease subunit R n=1 Tax=uncultured Brachyspira sp. TaxID=221953 RepID=UPI00263457ED|nr:type I restriction endonuclease subunit R [uncultured Brachyspira sp.]
MNPEEKAREEIDKLLINAGWEVVNKEQLDIKSDKGIALRELVMSDNGRADYILIYKGKALGIIESKKYGTHLSVVEEQSKRYSNRLPSYIKSYSEELHFIYESNGKEIYFRDTRDIDYRSRKVFAFHKAETLLKYIKDNYTLRNRLKNNMPLLQIGDLRECQFNAINSIEKSLSENHTRTLIQMATGTGKTIMAINLFYRLIKYAKAERILFLVDRNNLGSQAKNSFDDFYIENRKFSELYAVQHLKSNVIDYKNSKIVITTIQRLYSILRNEEEYDISNEDKSAFENADNNIMYDVSYNPNFPIELFDFIVVDECHRSIYGQWQKVLNYFDAFIIGLTATPSKNTIGYFNGNLVYEYPLEHSIIDGINVGERVFRIKTQIGEYGAALKEKTYVPIVEKKTRREIYEALEEDIIYNKKDLDRKVVSLNHIRTVIEAYKQSLFTQLYPDREQTFIPKTLIFAKDDNHAENIVRITREVFNKGNEFCKKITYSADNPQGLIKDFKNNTNFRIAVSVDMIATGTDIKPLEVLIFMRNVSSSVYYEQMKGRGVRTIDNETLKTATPNAKSKDFYYLIDAVGITETEKTLSQPLERKNSLSTEKIIEMVKYGGNVEENILTTLVSRITVLQNKIKESVHKTLKYLADGKTLHEICIDIYNTVDADIIKDKTEEEIYNMRYEALKPFYKPDFRNELIKAFKNAYLIIDNINSDEIIFTDFSVENANKIAKSFKDFIDSNKDSIEALKIIYSSNNKALTYEILKDLREKLLNNMPPLQTSIVWESYYLLDKKRVRSKKPEDIITNLIQLVRFVIGKDDKLENFNEAANIRFEFWKGRQKKNYNIEFSEEENILLNILKNYIISNGYISDKKEIHEALTDENHSYKEAKHLFEKLYISKRITLEEMVSDLSTNLIS